VRADRSVFASTSRSQPEPARCDRQTGFGWWPAAAGRSTLAVTSRLRHVACGGGTREVDDERTRRDDPHRRVSGTRW
jgi:hypothetical protein